MNITSIPLDQIEVGDRLRTIDPEYVAEIAASIRERGLQQPIEVRQIGQGAKYKLVFGAHRLLAAKAAGLRTIDATVFKGSETEARLREIDENLVRRDLSYLDRAKFLLEREELWRRANPDWVRGKAGAQARWHATETVSFASDVAEKLGLCAKTVENWLKVGREAECLRGDIRERVARSFLANKPAELRQLISLANDNERTRVLDVILSGQEDAPKNIKQALAIALQQLPEHKAPAELAAEGLRKFLRIWEQYPEAHADIRAFIKTQGRKEAA